jgi:hypothetical protein
MSSGDTAGNSPGNNRPEKVVVISHSPLFYWWPVWAVGFLMASLTYLYGYQVAFVPPDTVAERGVRLERYEEPRDILIAPKGKPLPSIPGLEDPDDLKQPRLRMMASNEPGVIWASVLCLVVVISQVPLRGLWSLLLIVVLVFASILLGVLELWAPIFQVIWVIDIHLTGFSYLVISLFLFTVWLASFAFFDRQVYMIFTRGQLRVRLAISLGETVYDTRGMVVERHRDDLFRHWLLGFGSGDLTVRPSGANTQPIELRNVLGIGRKLKLIHTMLQEREVVRGSR